MTFQAKGTVSAEIKTGSQCGLFKEQKRRPVTGEY